MTSQLQQHIASSQRFKDVRCWTSERRAFPKEHSTFLLGLDASEGCSAKTHVPQVRTSPANTEHSRTVVWHKVTADRVLIVDWVEGTRVDALEIFGQLCFCSWCTCTQQQQEINKLWIISLLESNPPHHTSALNVTLKPTYLIYPTINNPISCLLYTSDAADE